MRLRDIHHELPLACSGAVCPCIGLPTPNSSLHCIPPSCHATLCWHFLISKASLAYCRSLLTGYCCKCVQSRRVFNMPRALLLFCIQQKTSAHVCRFGAQFKVPMPDMRARREILKLILSNHEREMPYSVDPALLEVGLPRLRSAPSFAWDRAALL